MRSRQFFPPIIRDFISKPYEIQKKTRQIFIEYYESADRSQIMEKYFFNVVKLTNDANYSIKSIVNAFTKSKNISRFGVLIYNCLNFFVEKNGQMKNKIRNLSSPYLIKKLVELDLSYFNGKVDNFGDIGVCEFRDIAINSGIMRHEIFYCSFCKEYKKTEIYH